MRIDIPAARKITLRQEETIFRQNLLQLPQVAQDLFITEEKIAKLSNMRNKDAGFLGEFVKGNGGLAGYAKKLKGVAGCALGFFAVKDILKDTSDIGLTDMVPLEPFKSNMRFAILAGTLTFGLLGLILEINGYKRNKWRGEARQDLRDRYGEAGNPWKERAFAGLRILRVAVAGAIL